MSERLDPKVAAEHVQRIRVAVGQVLVGQDEVVEQVLWGLVAGGHVLLEGAPGLGKTLLVRTLSSCVDLKFSRIQFTPDLMPSDVTGTHVLVDGPQGRKFVLQKGPVFAQVVLADEINRATPKTQSSLLEAMQEHAVTMAGERHVLEEPFYVLATENPIEMEGTYPLPEAQLDRFLFKVMVPSPTEDELVAVLGRTTGQAVSMPTSVIGRDDLLALQATCRDVAVAEPVLRYAARLVRACDPTMPEAPSIVKRAIRVGAGVRAAQALVLGAKAAALSGARMHAGFEDIQRVAKPSMRHRMIRSFEGEADGVTTDQVVEAVLAAIPSRPAEVNREVAAARN
ncbi:MAG: AAA family ATPase [Myxococcales bacterium]|nr:AAA family ATPase [Myxococcales bacterium]